MNDIKVLENYINGKDTMKETLEISIKNIIKRNENLEKQVKYYKKMYNECNNMFIKGGE